MLISQNNSSALMTSINGGEAGIRTLGGLQTLNGFQDRRFRPLSHLSVRARYNTASFFYFPVFYNNFPKKIRLNAAK